MRDLGELSLLGAFVGSGFAAVACLGGPRHGRRLWVVGIAVAAASVAALTLVIAILAWALVAKDFSFDYVAQYSSTLLPWHYSLSALWVGQAGSLLLWAWFCGVLALWFVWRSRRVHSPSQSSSVTAGQGSDASNGRAADEQTWPRTGLANPGPADSNLPEGSDHRWAHAHRSPAGNAGPAGSNFPRIAAAERELPIAAFGVLLGYVCFLLAIMVFAADPMEASVAAPREGAGLSPLLQHPAMLLHPPVVFLGYALWTIPFALAAVALAAGHLDATWVRLARPWAVAAWAVLGGGILLGADWAYEELGWGGYWGWDPVENGSLMPWLTGTALIHAMMAWQYRGGFKTHGPGPGRRHLRAVQLRDVPDPQRHLQQLARLQRVAHRLAVPGADVGAGGRRRGLAGGSPRSPAARTADAKRAEPRRVRAARRGGPAAADRRDDGRHAQHGPLQPADRADGDDGSVILQLRADADRPGAAGHDRDGSLSALGVGSQRRPAEGLAVVVGDRRRGGGRGAGLRSAASGRVWASRLCRPWRWPHWVGP